MQLKNKQIGKRLTLATSALLGSLQAQAADDWEVSSALLMYSEADDRVQAVEPVLNLSRQFDDESSINVRVIYDALTGSSPNGAMPASVAQTFTSASAAARIEQAEEDDDEEELEKYGDRGSYTIAPGDLPLDPSFEDNRTVLSLGWTRPLSNGYTMNLGGAYSSEGDFTSFSVNGALARDFNNKATTVSLGLNLEADSINPNGGVPTALTMYGAGNTDGSDDTKQVVDLMLGVTQVMNRRWLMQFNLGLSQSSGYQNDPYKILTVVNDGNLIVNPDDPESYLYLFENRPEDRQKMSIFLQNKVAIGADDVIDVGYRYMTDDWSVNSHTLDLTYHWQISEGLYLEPHYRYYRQSAADFYTPFLNAGSEVEVVGSSVTALVDEASSDPRLGAFSADTMGLKVGLALGSSSELSLRYEVYQQHDDNSLKAVAAGSHLDGMSQFAELSASWVQLGYTFRW